MSDDHDTRHDNPFFGPMAILVMGLLLLLAVGAATFFAFRAQMQARQAEEMAIRAQMMEMQARQEAERLRALQEREAMARERAEKFVYSSRIHEAANELKQGNLARCREILLICEKDPSPWEHQWLSRQTHRRLPVSDAISKPLRAVAFSPNGTTLAAAGEDSVILLLDAKSQQIKARLEGHKDPVNDLTFTPNGNNLISCSEKGDLILWDLQQRKSHWTMTEKSAAVSLAVSPDGKWVAVGRADKTVRVHDLQRGKEEKVIPAPSDITTVAISPKRQLITAAFQNGTASMWDREGKLIQQLVGHREAIHDLCFSPDGNRVASCSDREIFLYEAATGKLDRSLPGVINNPPGANGFRSIAFTPDGKRVVTGSANGILRSQDLATEEQWEVQAHSHAIVDLAIHPNGQSVVTASVKPPLGHWSIATTPGLLRIQTVAQSVHSMTVSSDGALVAIGGEEGDVSLYDLKTGKEKFAWNGQLGKVVVAISPDNRLLASGDGNGAIYLRQLPSGKLEAKWDKEKEAIVAMAFSPDGKSLLVSRNDRRPALWSPESKKVIARLEVEPTTTALAQATDKPDVYAGTSEGSVWHGMVSQPAFANRLYQHPDPITVLLLTPDRKQLISAAQSGPILSWDLEKKESRERIRGPGSVSDMAISPNGDRLALAIGDTIKIFSLSLGQELLTIKEPDRVTAVRFDSSDNQLITANKAGQVAIRNAKMP